MPKTRYPIVMRVKSRLEKGIAISRTLQSVLKIIAGVIAKTDIRISAGKASSVSRSGHAIRPTPASRKT
jgi:hypothetical protein